MIIIKQGEYIPAMTKLQGAVLRQFDWHTDTLDSYHLAIRWERLRLVAHEYDGCIVPGMML